jgi:hypothetical protein
MVRYLVPLMLAGACLLAAPDAHATVVKAVSLEDSIRGSEAILVGRVMATRTFEDNDGRVMTGVTLRVEEALKGAFRGSDSVEVAALGGSLGGRRMAAIGEATYRVGERVLVQLETIDGRWRTIGLALGKWTLARDERGADQLRRDLSGLAFAGRAQVTSGPVRLDDFRRAVQAQGR